MTVDEMLARISSAELTEWEAFASIEPIGDAREDLRMAILASIIANTARDPEKRRDPFTPADFIVDFWAEDEPAEITEETWKHNLALAEVMTAALGGKYLRKDGNDNSNPGGLPGSEH